MAPSWIFKPVLGAKVLGVDEKNRERENSGFARLFHEATGVAYTERKGGGVYWGSLKGDLDGPAG